MSYRARVLTLLTLFFVVVIAANAGMVYLSSQWASDEMNVGHHHSKFPPLEAPPSPALPRQGGGSNEVH